MSEEMKEAVETAEVVSETNPMDAIFHDENAPIVTMKKLLEAGCHIGHQTKRWNPKMGKFIYGARNGVYILDLVKTIDCINVAYAKMEEIVENKGVVLFVGTKPQSKESIELEAKRSGCLYITNRWLGGTLTNFRTINSRIKLLSDLKAREESGEFDYLAKTEAAGLRKQIEKLSKNLDGIAEMRRLPRAIFVVDPTNEYNAVREARKLNIPVFGIVDTNSDPDLVDYPIPANDDAARSISLIVAIMADAIFEAKGGVPQVAFANEEGEDITMKEVIKQTDKENAEKLARIRAERAARAAQFQREQEVRSANIEAKINEANKEEAAAPKARKPRAKKEPVAEAPAEEEAK